MLTLKYARRKLILLLLLIVGTTITVQANVNERAQQNSENVTLTTTATTTTNRIWNWIQESTTTIKELMILKKNIIAAWPLELAANAIDLICSSTLFMHHVPQKVIPDINAMHFQYITPCKNYSVALMDAEKLWRHTRFNKMKKVVILATGWTNTVNESATLEMLSHAFLCRREVNFIIVDAASYVDTLYKWAALNTEEIGINIGIGLTQLIKLVPLANIHLVGHSLGAHIMGAAARHFHKLTGLLIPRVTGLDPAKPCFRHNNTLSSLQRGDAAFVDIIHTNIGILAKTDPIGDLDFYPGGANALPPGCFTISCAHSRAVEYFTESVYPGNERNFICSKCATWQALKNFDCRNGAKANMGYKLSKQVKGIYYCDVKRKSPFGRNANLTTALKWEQSQCHQCTRDDL